MFITHKFWPRIRTCFSLHIIRRFMRKLCVYLCLSVPVKLFVCGGFCVNIVFSPDIYLTEPLRSIHSTCCQHEIPSFCLISIARTFYLCGLHFGRHFARTHKKYYTFAKCEPSTFLLSISLSLLIFYIFVWIIFSHRRYVFLYFSF